MTYWLSTTPGMSTASTSSTMTLPVTYVSNGSVTAWPEAPARPGTALEWLDGEIERMCALARL